MSDVVREHERTSPKKVRCAVVTVSDTRTSATDVGGKAIVELLAGAGHEVAAVEIVPDEPKRLRALLEQLRDDPTVDAVLVTGGTGIAARDQTCETVEAALTRSLPGFGELFRMLSYAEIGAAAMLSRATGGLMERTIVLAMPGSPAGVELAMRKIILPQLAHLVREACR